MRQNDVNVSDVLNLIKEYKEFKKLQMIYCYKNNDQIKYYNEVNTITTLDDIKIWECYYGEGCHINNMYDNQTKTSNLSFSRLLSIKSINIYLLSIVGKTNRALYFTIFKLILKYNKLSIDDITLLDSNYLRRTYKTITSGFSYSEKYLLTHNYINDIKFILCACIDFYNHKNINTNIFTNS